MEPLDLSYFFKTKAQANDFTTRLATIIQHVYDIDFNLERALLESFGIQKKDKFMVLLRENGINTEKVDLLKTFLLKMQENIAKLPILELTLAFEPKERTLQALSEWFLMNIKRQVLLTISIDHTLIAGAKINFNGKFIDGSIKPVFDTILQTMETPPPPPPREEIKENHTAAQQPQT